VLQSFTSTEFWIPLAQIIGVNIVLSGDNAVVIALACRSLSPAQQKKGIIFGSAGAILLRIVLTFFAANLLKIAYLKLAGAALLVWIGVKLLVNDDQDGGMEIESHGELFAAIKTIITADVVMSLDNVIGVAAAAHGDLVLMILGLLISIPLIIFGSTAIMHLMERLPIIITLGGGLLGYVAGEMAVSDPGVPGWVEEKAHWLHNVLPISLALLVVAVGTWLDRRASRAEKPLIDLAQSAERQNISSKD
jgi:YjbE family integral membrane protein